MCNIKACFWEVFKITSNIIYNIKKSIANATPNELTISVHNNFIEIRNELTYYIYKNNTITEETSLLTLTKMEQLNKITTNFFIPYIIVYYKNRCINLELQGFDYTFYVVGNKINRDLITFYLDKKEDIKLNEDDVYTIEFMNSEMKTTFITDQSEIYFDKDNYKII